MIYAFGAWGTGNLGDDAILEGMRLEYGPSLIAVCSHPSTIPAPAIHNDELINSVKEGDTVLFGGGGLCYSYAAVRDMIKLAKGCKDKKARSNLS